MFSIPHNSAARVVAGWWLIVLTVFPFSMPMATLDAGAFHAVSVAHGRRPDGHVPDGVSLARAAVAHAPIIVPNSLARRRTPPSERPSTPFSFSRFAAPLDLYRKTGNPEVLPPFGKEVLRI